MNTRSIPASGPAETRGPSTRPGSARLAIALSVGVALGGLGACSRPEPHPAYEAPPPPPPALAGDPDAAPTAAPAPDMAPPPPPSDVPEPPPAHSEGLVAMAPIPNPEDGGPAPPHARYVRPYAPAPQRHPHGPHLYRMAPAHARARLHPAASPPHPAPPVVHTVPHAPAHAAHLTAKSASTVAPTLRAKPVKPHAATVHTSTGTTVTSTTATNTTGANTAGANTTGANSTGATDSRTEALRSALSSAIAQGAVLSVPKFSGDQAGEVTLTVPASFDDTLKQEAGRQAMGDAAASANLDATLMGDGYAIIPAGAQAQPLRAGQPTVFRWTVTSPAGAKGPLRADVTAELLGGGAQTLALGAVNEGGAGSASKWWGAGLLALVVALGLGWLVRSRSADARIAASRRRAQRPDGTINGQRPLDITRKDGDPR